MNVPASSKKGKKASSPTSWSDFFGNCFCVLLLIGMVLFIWRDYLHREAREAYWETMHPEIRPPKDVFMDDGCVGGIQIRDRLPSWSSVTHYVPVDVLVGGGFVLGIIAAFVVVAASSGPSPRDLPPSYKEYEPPRVEPQPIPPPKPYDKAEAYAAWGPGP